MLFVFDENLPQQLCKGLDMLEQANLRSPHKVEAKYAIEVMGKKGAPDEDLIVKVGELDGILITQDKDFRSKKHYFTLYKEYNIGVVLYSLPSKDVYWDKVKSFIKNWEDVKQRISEIEKPFALIISKTGGIQTYDF
ncbi:MAG: hypothetical protein H6550_15025 [Chitinophagales bacterium]|nr:hypothetical protein [Chitinophagales bacterium]